MGEVLYDVQGAKRFFQRGPAIIEAVGGVDLQIEAGEVVALEGPSGSGKTTLLQLLGALDRPSAGSVLFEGRDLASLGDGELADLRLRAFGFVFQQFNLIPTLTALENVEAKLAPVGVPADELRDRCWRCLQTARHQSNPLSLQPYSSPSIRKHTSFKDISILPGTVKLTSVYRTRHTSVNAPNCPILVPASLKK